MDGVVFDSKSADRISDSVQYTEKLIQSGVLSRGQLQPTAVIDAVVARVRNRTGSSVSEGTPLVLRYSDSSSGWTEAGYKYNDVFWGYAVVDSSEQNRVGIVVGSIANGAVGLVMTHGIATVTADVTDAAHTCVTLDAGGFASSTSGFQIVTSRTQTGGSSLVNTGSQLVQILLPLGGTGGGSSGHDGFIVLIDKDIEPIKETDPAYTMTSADVTLTSDEIAASYTVVFQDPVPTDDNYDDNHVDDLNLWDFKGTKLDLKYYVADTDPDTGTAISIPTSDSIKLASDASTVNDFYAGDTIVVDSQTRTILSYVASTQTATVDSNWSPTPSDLDYEITSLSDLKLVTTIIDDPDHMDGETPAPRKIVRYATKEVWWLDGKGLSRGEYKLPDYPDYPEDEQFPPDGTGTFPELTAGFLKKRYRAKVTYAAGRYWIDPKTCKALPPPALPTE